MAGPVRVIKAGPPALSPPPDDDPKDWEKAWNEVQYGIEEPHGMSIENLGGEEVIPYMSEEELLDGANKWNYINPDSPNLYRIELNRRMVDHQSGNVNPFETADAQDFAHEMGRRERGGERAEWQRAGREDEPIPEGEGAEYQHSLRTDPDVDLQTDMYQQMMQNDPLNPIFTAGEPMDIAWRLLKDMDTEDYRQAARTGGLRETPERKTAYREAGLPYMAPVMIPSGTQKNAEQMMAYQRNQIQKPEWYDAKHLWRDAQDDWDNWVTPFLEGEEDNLQGMEPRIHPSDVESMTSGPSMPDPHTEPEPETVGRSEVVPRDHTIPEHVVQHRTERMPEHQSDWYSSMPDYSMLEEGPQGQALAALHQRQQRQLPDFGGLKEKQRLNDLGEYLMQQEKQRIAESRVIPSTATSNIPPMNLDITNNPQTAAQTAAMDKLKQRQLANIARQRAAKDARTARRRGKRRR